MEGGWVMEVPFVGDDRRIFKYVGPVEGDANPKTHLGKPQTNRRPVLLGAWLISKGGNRLWWPPWEGDSLQEHKLLQYDGKTRHSLYRSIYCR